MVEILLKPLGWILREFSLLFGGNFAAGVFAFTVVVNAIMIPLNIKTQKSTVGQMRIRPKLDALKAKCGDNRQKFATEQQKLMQDEGVSMSGGCLPLLIRMPIMFGIYAVVLSPLKYIAGISAEHITAATNAFNAINPNMAKNAYLQPQIINAINNGSINFNGIESVKQSLSKFNFSFLGIDLTGKPEFNVDIANHFNINWLIPIMAFAAAMLTSIITMKMQKKANPDSPNMTGLMLTTPLISLIIGFTVSCAAGFYWACSSLVSGIIQVIVLYFYGPNKMIAAEQKKELYKVYKDQKKIKENKNAKTEDTFIKE